MVRSSNRFSRALAVASALSALLVLSGSACVAPLQPVSSPVTQLEARGYGEMVVDDQYGHLFVSSPVAGRITVLDLGGKVVGSLDLPRADQLLLDGPYLYATGTLSSVVERFSRATLARVEPLVPNLLVGVSDLAAVDGAVWAAVGCIGDREKGVVRIDPATGQFRRWPVSPGPQCARLVADPLGHRLFAGDRNSTSGVVFSIDVSTDPPTSSYNRQQLDTYQVGNFIQGQVSPDGATLYVAGVFTTQPPGGVHQTTYGVIQMRTADLAFEPHVFRVPAYALGVAVTGANGGIVAIETSRGVTTHRLATPDVIDQELPVGTADYDPARTGVALSANGTRLFLISISREIDPVVRVHTFDLTGHTTG
jgi:hypothetical protein